MGWTTPTIRKRTLMLQLTPQTSPPSTQSPRSGSGHHPAEGQTSPSSDVSHMPCPTLGTRVSIKRITRSFLLNIKTLPFLPFLDDLNDNIWSIRSVLLSSFFKLREQKFYFSNYVEYLK